MKQESLQNSVANLMGTPEFLDRVLQAAPNGLAIVDPEGRILYVNRKMTEMFGYSPEEMKQLQVQQLVSEQFGDLHSEYRRAFMAEPAARQLGLGRDLFALRKDGSEFPAEIGASTLHVGDQVYILASVVDITQRQQADESARVHARRMEAVNEQIAAYTSAISHDLRAPLRAIRNYVDFLVEDIGRDLAPQPRQYLEALRTAVREADRMILDLLKLGRISSVDVLWAPVDFNELLAGIRRTLAMTEDVQLIAPADWPDIEAPHVLLVHVFQNLIDNAVKFNNSSPKRVEIGWRPVDKAHVEFYVRDNGIGIDPRHYDRLFDPFERLHAAEDYEGTGIGLALVKKAVTVLDGQIRVESQPGRGTTFFITLPLRRHANE